MTRKITVKLTANFEKNLGSIAEYLTKVDALQSYDSLLNDLSNALIPNLENFPAMGRSFLKRPTCSVEVANALLHLQSKLLESELREYLLSEYLVLYAQIDDIIYLLSIMHHRQLSFNFHSFWPVS